MLTKRPLLLEASLNSGLPRGLDDVCQILNGEPTDLLCQELRKLVTAWQESGPNLRKMLAMDKTLAERMNRGSTFLVPTDDGHGYLGWEPVGLGNRVGWDGIALRSFLWLIVSQEWWRLGGPCARCGRYYVKRRKSQKTYCTRRCGSAATATANTKEKRAAKHADKLMRARALVVTWSTARTRLNWKTWTSKRDRELTPKFLTRALNKGELEQPRKGKGRS